MQEVSHSPRTVLPDPLYPTMRVKGVLKLMTSGGSSPKLRMLFLTLAMNHPMGELTNPEMASLSIRAVERMSAFNVHGRAHIHDNLHLEKRSGQPCTLR